MSKKTEEIKEDIKTKSNFCEICLGEGICISVASDVADLPVVINAAHALSLNISRRIPSSNEYRDHAII